jgi:DNA-binding NtrC family response regulator
VKRLLVVDDDAAIVGKLKVLLEAKYEVVVATNGFDALKRLDAGRCDLMLLDLRMPGLDGPGLLADMKGRGVSLPVIVMSASVDLPERARAMGVEHALTKPFDIEHLEALVERLLGGPV